MGANVRLTSRQSDCVINTLLGRGRVTGISTFFGANCATIQGYYAQLVDAFGRHVFILHLLLVTTGMVIVRSHGFCLWLIITVEITRWRDS